jgi:hypothetical protein
MHTGRASVRKRVRGERFERVVNRKGAECVHSQRGRFIQSGHDRERRLFLSVDELDVDEVSFAVELLYIDAEWYAIA